MTTMTASQKLRAPRPLPAAPADPAGAATSAARPPLPGGLGQRVVAGLVAALISRGTRPVEDLDELDAGDVPGPVLANPDLDEGAGREPVRTHGRA